MWIVDWCIVYTGIRLLLLIRPIISSFSFFSNYQTLKIFVTFFSGIVRSSRLKLGTHVDSGQMYWVYPNQAAAYLSLYFFIFPSLFVTLFSRTVRPRRLKLGTHVDSGQMYSVYRNQAAAAYWSPYFFIFFLSNFQTLRFLAHLSRRLTRWAYSIPMVCRPSVVVRHPLSSTLSNLNISEAIWPILIRYYM